MPIIVTNIGPHYFAEIQRKVDGGVYASVAEFVELAVANQVELENERAADHSAGSSASRPPKRQRAPQNTAPTRRRGPKRQPSAVTGPHAADALVWLQSAVDAKSPSGITLKPPASTGGEGAVWGQVNRLLPLKLVLRWVAAQSIRSGGWPRFDEALEPMAADAATIGSALEHADAAAGRMRDELLATGLPRRGNALSSDRFVSQYVARTTRKGTVHPGAAVQYGLLLLEPDVLLLTTTGFEFAVMRNPVMDGDLGSAKETLSDEERRFFLSHVVPHLASESHDFQLILGFVKSGHDTPADQLELVREHLPGDWSDTMVRTHATGVIARMIDLGLLRRQWQGRHVRYETTELAAEFADAHYQCGDTHAG